MLKGSSYGHKKKTRVKSPPVEKRAVMSLSGRDNRTPFVGGTQFPTEGSKSYSRSLLDKATRSAEVGPVPSTYKLDRTDISPLKQVVPKIPLPPHTKRVPVGFQKVSAANMSHAQDPLVNFIEKRAEVLSDNLDAFKTRYDELDRAREHTSSFASGKPKELEQRPVQSRDSDFIGTPAEDKAKDTEEYLKELFTHFPSEHKSVG